MKIKFCGASTSVTGSCHMLSTENHKILLDCGQFQGGKTMEELNYEEFPFEPSEIESVILSHAHIDHCGRIPLLVKRGFRGKIYCTDATADLLDVMLKDSGYIHEKEAEWKNKKNQRLGRKLVEPLYTYKDACEALTYVSPIRYDQILDLNDEMRIVFNDAGHILGSAITEIWVREGEKEAKIVFSGDLGVINRPILRDPTIIKKADYVIMETTYGSRNHSPNATSISQLLDIVLRTTDRGGSVIIPSFAVGRTQELIYQFNRFYEEHKDVQSKLDKIMVYIDSPMATTATDVFRRNAQVFDEETKAYILKGDNPLDFKNLRFTRNTAESQALNMDITPKVIISASGMCDAGRIRHHLKHNLWNPKNSIVFVGYQAQGTLGRYLIEGAKDITLFGEEVHVQAEIYNLDGFSGHADQNGLFNWISGFQVKPKQVFLVHGEEESKEVFGKLIAEKLGIDPVVVKGNSEFDLDMITSKITNMEEANAQAMDYDRMMAVKGKIAQIHGELENILYNANLAVDGAVSEERLVKINNIVADLEKATLSLGSTVTEELHHIEDSIVE